jgi:hypothetical protein
MSPDHDHDPNTNFPNHYHVLDGLVRVVDRREVTESHGLVHMRRELLMDLSYESFAGVLGSADDWKYGLEFRDVETSPPLVLFFSADCRRLLRHPPTVGTGVAAPAPDFAAGLKTVFEEWRTAER